MCSLLEGFLFGWFLFILVRAELQLFPHQRRGRHWVSYVFCVIDILKETIKGISQSIRALIQHKEGL